MGMRRAKVFLIEAIPVDFDICNGIKSPSVRVLGKT